MGKWNNIVFLFPFPYSGEDSGTDRSRHRSRHGAETSLTELFNPVKRRVEPRHNNILSLRRLK